MRSQWVKISLAVLLVVALGVRLYQIDSLSNTFHLDRQLYTAQMVRGQYWGNDPSVPEWRRKIAMLNQPPMLEPPIVQTIALVGYQLTGGEHLWIPRVFSAVMWVIGGWFMFLTAKKLVREEAALVAVAFYLFTAFGIAASRSFQANPAMIALCVMSWYGILHYFERPSMWRLILAAAAAAAANLVLIYAVFMIFPLYGWIAIQKYGFRRAVLNRDAWLFAFLAMLPSIIYYFIGFFVAGFLKSQTGALFNPHLWTSGDYWVNWLGRIGVVMGFLALILSIQALVTTRKPLQAATLRSLWLGYFLYGFIINWPISSHDYYSLQVIPIAALSLSCVADVVANGLRSPRMRRFIPVLILLIAGYIGFDGLVHYLPTTVVTPEMEKDVAIVEEVGNLLKHSPDVLALTNDYAALMKFYGEVGGVSWPNRWNLYAAQVAGQPDMTTEERMQALVQEHRYRYFVVTSFDELKYQPDLEPYLQSHYPVLVRTNDYIVYDMR